MAVAPSRIVAAHGSPTLRARVEAKIDRSGGPEACWPWQGAYSQKRRSRRPNVRVGGVKSPAINPARLVLG